MEKDELEKFRFVEQSMDGEGFHYCFTHYSDFPEIEDEKFHKLRKQYQKISEELEMYIRKKTNNTDYF
mgnify:CR=1 FL=1